MTGLRIVVPTVRDAERLGRLHHRVRREMYRQVGANVPESTPEDSVASWLERLRHVDSAGRDDRGCTLRAAFGSERLVGFVVAGPGRDPGWEAVGELWALSVHPDWRGSGAADALVDAALPAGLVYLWVLQGNGRAIAFYRRLGFTADGAARVDASTGATDLRMLRPAGPAPAPRP